MSLLIASRTNSGPDAETSSTEPRDPKRGLWDPGPDTAEAVGKGDQFHQGNCQQVIIFIN